jgi:uncharacterized protein involved in type VI secretion and phage assembly
MTIFYGKYRGKVTDNKDPRKLGRVQVNCPAVLGDGISSWAMPCSPYAGKDVGFFALPPVGANVWVEFEGGNSNYPIWGGCFWGENEVPQEVKDEKVKLLKVQGTKMILNEDQSGGFTLEVGSPVSQQPLKMIFNSQGIEISFNNAKINLKSASLESVFSSSSIKQTADSIELSFGNAKIKEAAAGIDISNGAAKINLSPARVSINDGALEVI